MNTGPQEQAGSHSVTPGAGTGHRTLILPKSPFLVHVEPRMSVYNSKFQLRFPREGNPALHIYFKESMHQNQHSMLTLGSRNIPHNLHPDDFSEEDFFF